MQELEKILEEIEEEQRSYEADHAWNYARGMEHAADIIRKHMKNEEDILKFYYCESEDDYYLGQRAQNMYYAKYEPGGFTWFMSRYLPWGEEGYPSEPKEIPFTEWLDGFIRKHMNDGWIPVEKFGLPHSNEHDFRFWVTIQYINGFRHTIKAKWDCFDKCFMHQNGKKILQDVIAYKYYSAPEPYRPERSNDEKK